jgi:hypothetical protein
MVITLRRARRVHALRLILHHRVSPILSKISDNDTLTHPIQNAEYIHAHLAQSHL